MKNIYTWAAKPAKRTLTVADLKSAKGKRKFTQVTANSVEEADAAEKAGFDIPCPQWHEMTQEGPIQFYQSDHGFYQVPDMSNTWYNLGENHIYNFNVYFSHFSPAIREAAGSRMRWLYLTGR